MKLFALISIAAASLWAASGFGAVAAQGWDPRDKGSEDAALVGEAREAVAAFRAADPTLEAYFREAYGYAVLPSVTKGGLGLGAARGKGVLFRGDAPRRKVYLTQVTIGAQIGGKKFSEILFFRDAEAYEAFDDGEFEVSAQATANVARSGAGETASYDAGVAIFVLDKGGAMAEASVGGQKFKTEPLK